MIKNKKLIMQYTSVNPKTFFTDYLLDPLSKDISKTDRAICMIASVILGILSLGILHLGFAIYNWSQRDVVDQTEDLAKAPLLSRKPPIPIGQRDKKARKDIAEIDQELEYTLRMINEAGLEESAYERLERLANQIVRNAKQLIIECTEEPELRTFILESTKSELSSLITIGQGIEQDEFSQKSFNEAKWVLDMTSAVRSGDNEALLVAIHEGLDINCRAPIWLNGTILHHLAKLGRHPQLVEVLASNGIDFDVIDKWGNSAVMWAIANGRNSIADEMLNYEQDLDILCHGNTALHLVIAKGYKGITFDGAQLTVSNLQLMQKIIASNADVNIVNIRGLTALHIACMRRDPEMIQALLKAGAKPETLTRDGESCLELLELTHEEAKQRISDITPPFLLPRDDFDRGYEPSKALFQ